MSGCDRQYWSENVHITAFGLLGQIFWFSSVLPVWRIPSGIRTAHQSIGFENYTGIVRAAQSFIFVAKWLMILIPQLLAVTVGRCHSTTWSKGTALFVKGNVHHSTPSGTSIGSVDREEETFGWVWKNSVLKFAQWLPHWTSRWNCEAVTIVLC